LPECRIEDLLFELGMDLQFLFDPGQQLLACLHRSLGGFFELAQQVFDGIVVLLQQFDGIHRLALLRSANHIVGNARARFKRALDSGHESRAPWLFWPPLRPASEALWRSLAKLPPLLWPPLRPASEAL